TQAIGINGNEQQIGRIDKMPRRRLLDLGRGREMNVAVAHVDPGTPKRPGRLRVPPQRSVADLVYGARHAPVPNPACCGPPLPSEPRRSSPTNRNNHSEMIRLLPSRGAATWKHDICSYISSVTQATSGKEYLEDHRHVDARSDLDRT